MITISAFRWVPDFAQGQVRDLRARWALEEAGLPYRTRLLGQGDQDKPDYRNLQPFGQVPMLEEDGFVLFKSGAIVLHVGERSETLLPLPWVRVDKTYVFEGPDGKETLAQLFGDRSQLLIYHFMFGPDWAEGCPSCSFWADNYDGVVVHLQHRDVSLVVVSRAPLDKLEAYKGRMGWNFKWVSSLGCDFNRDYHVSFTPEEQKTAVYNYKATGFGSSEAPGVSVFAKGAEGRIFHTYSCYARGLDTLNGAYQLLDLVPKGRDEQGLSHSMAWLRRHDRYGT